MHVVHQNFHAATDAAVIEIGTEPPNLKRLATALMLSGFYARVQLMKDLIVAGK